MLFSNLLLYLDLNCLRGFADTARYAKRVMGPLQSVSGTGTFWYWLICSTYFHSNKHKYQTVLYALVCRYFNFPSHCSSRFLHGTSPRMHRVQFNSGLPKCHRKVPTHAVALSATEEYEDRYTNNFKWSFTRGLEPRTFANWDFCFYQLHYGGALPSH